MGYLALCVLLLAASGLATQRLIAKHWRQTGLAGVDRVARGLVVLGGVAVGAALFIAAYSLSHGGGFSEHTGEQVALALSNLALSIASTAGPLFALAAILDVLASRVHQAP